MICPKCQTVNAEGSKFCIKCGEQLPNTVSPTINQNINVQPVENVIPPEPVVNPGPVMKQVPNISQEPIVNQEPVVQNIVSNNIPNANMETEKLNMFGYLKSFIIKPYATYEQYEKQFTDSKNALLLSGIIALFMMIINIITTFISTIIISYGGKINIDFGMLEFINVFDLIFKNLLSSFGTIAIIAFVYYVVGLIFKKNSNFLKLLVATASSSLPYILISVLLATILAYIWAPLAFIATIIGAIITLIVFLNLIGKEFSFPNKDQEILFHIICLSVICIGGYLIMSKIFEPSSGLGAFLDY